MASRKSNDTTSQNGVSFSPGNPNAMTQKSINLSQQVNNKVATSTAYNGHAIEVWADGAVFDTVSGTFLFPFRDYDPNNLERT
jgi:hypothetical protein